MIITEEIRHKKGDICPYCKGGLDNPKVIGRLDYKGKTGKKTKTC